MIAALLWIGSAALVSGCAAACYLLVRLPSEPRPALGNRGLQRARAMESGGAFALVEGPTRYLAARLPSAGPRCLEKRLDVLLVQSGDHLGLCSRELLALSFSSTVVFVGLAAIARGIGELPIFVVPIGGALGALLPIVRIRALVGRRLTAVTRSLPGVIELTAMCMGAGLDFPGSLRRITMSAGDSTEPIIDELRRVLQELDLGRTRRSAMRGFAERVPSADVRELVHSVVQAEDKGTPLARVLTIQAQTLRLRRSISAEETASEAALMLIGPMTLIFICVIALLLGPVVLRFASGGVVA